MLYVGTMGWSYGFWKIYPKGMKSTDYLKEYSKYFNSVEINNSFYRIPREKTVKGWVNQVPDNFIFTTKFPQSISHKPNLKYEQEKLNSFLNNIKYLGKKKGPLLIQFPPKFKPDKITLLETLLQKLPNDNKYACEFRHKDWFNQNTYKMLKQYKIALVQVVHPWLEPIHEITSDFIYIRFEGNRKKVNGGKGESELDKTEEIQKWSSLIKDYLNKGLNVYAYFSKYFSGYPPSDVKNLKKRICEQE
jgi:uncharacterized protein YecE (DUF72 family)